MGGTHSLSNTAKQKHTHHGSAHGLSWGLSAMQGYRPTMEDDHTVDQSIAVMPKTSFFAVYDGHAGATVSKLAGTHILPSILSSWDQAGSDPTGEKIAGAMYNGILDFDANIRASYPRLQSLRDHSGSTLISTFVTETEIIFANVGDSRAVLSRNDAVAFATEDHKPQSRIESTRVLAAGGYVMMGRVCGNLAVSRALGDFVYKDRADLQPHEQKMSAAADLTVVQRDSEDQVLIVACDGIWDVMTNEQAVSFVLRCARSGNSPAEIAEKLIDLCLKRGSTDNMSAIIILFDNCILKRKTSRKASRADRKRTSNLSTTSKSNEELDGEGTIPMGLDRTRGRGSTSEIGAMIAKAQQGDDPLPDAEEEGDTTITPMMRDSSRGRGSVIVVGEELERVKAAMAKVAEEKPIPDKTSPVKVVTNV